MTGVGLAMTLDEVVFHQLLGWHHLDERVVWIAGSAFVLLAGVPS